LACHGEKVMSKIEKQNRWPKAPKSSDTILVLYISFRERKEKGEKNKMIYFINQELLLTYIIECHIYITHEKIKDKN